MYLNFFKPIYFVVSDTDPQYPPRTFEELRRRCDEIKREIPAKGDNKLFTEKLFTFFKDCGLITWENIALLSDKIRCDREFHCAMNPLGGVLRKEDLPMGNPKRYYCTKNRGRAVACDGFVYYISSQWYDTYANTNKAEFYNWVVNRALVNLGVPQNLQTRGLLYIPYY